MSNNYKAILKQEGHIISLQGKPFVTFKGLLWLAHKEGIEEVATEALVDLNRVQETGLAIFKATVKGKHGTYTATGDASPKNVSKNIARHCIRMAETRAICRALRLYLGAFIQMTALEEMGGD